MQKKLILFLAFVLFTASFSVAQSARYKLLVFEGSDWCANCIRFNTNVFTSSAFATFLEANNIAPEHIDFPQRKRLDKNTRDYNAMIAEKYKFKGLFPTILLIDTKTDKATELTYQNQKPEDFIALIQSKLDAH